MVQKHLVRSIKYSSEQLYFDRLHAACMHSACTPVKIEFLKNGFILMSVHDAHIIWVFYNYQLTGLHAFFLHEVQNVCHLSRLCVLHAISKSNWYVTYQTPYPMQGFLWKGGSTTISQGYFLWQIFANAILWQHNPVVVIWLVLPPFHKKPCIG